MSQRRQRGSLAGFLLLAGCPPCDSGSRPAALRFDGRDDLVQIVGVSPPGAEGYTLEAWIRPRRGPSPRPNILARRHPGGEGDTYVFRLRLDRGGVLELGMAGDGEAWGLLGQTPVPLDDWSHVAATWQAEPPRAQLFLDGKLDAEGVPRVSPTSGDLPLWVGADPLRGPAPRAFCGEMGEIRIWNEVRPPERLAEPVPETRDLQVPHLRYRSSWGFPAGGVGGEGREFPGLEPGADASDPEAIDEGPPPP